MPAHRVLCTYCLSCPFKAVADDTLMTSGQDPLTSGNQSSLLTFAVIHFHIITLFLPSEYVSPGFPLFSDHLFPQHATIIKFDCHVESNNGIWWFFLISNIHIQFWYQYQYSHQLSGTRSQTSFPAIPLSFHCNALNKMSKVKVKVKGCIRVKCRELISPTFLQFSRISSKSFDRFNSFHS